MSEPYFTIGIPTKNRPERLRNAINSVTAQTFSDFELIVCDNSDEPHAVHTAAMVAEFGDPRIRYVRTSGRLSMPDNWDRAVAAARGAFVGVLTDRSVFRRDALQAVHSEIQQTGASCVSWFNDLYDRHSRGDFSRRSSTLRRYRFDSGEVLAYFVSGHPKYAPKIIPRLMNSVCHRSILEEIRASPAGHCCPPVCPDYTSGFLMLSYCDWILKIDEALYTTCGVGTGSDFRRGGALGERFIQDLGMTRAEMVDRMPSDASFSYALVLNDFVRLRDMLPDRFAGFDVHPTQYYHGCLFDYVKATQGGADRSEDLRLLLDSLDHQTDDVQRDVRGARIYERAIALPAVSERHAEKKATDDPEDGQAPTRFDTVFDALAWDEAHPRVPASHGFLDSLPRYKDKARDEGKATQIDESRPKVKRRAGDEGKTTQIGESRPKVKRRVRGFSRLMHEAKKSLRHWGIVWRGRAHRAWMLVGGVSRQVRR